MRSRLIISMTSLALVNFISVSAGTTATKAQPTGRGDTQGDIWPMLDQNPQRTHYSALENVINEQNVTALTSLWRQSINRGGSNRWPSSNPVTYGGNVYVGGPSLTGPNFFAFSGIFGTPAWPNYPQGQNLGHTALDCFGVGIGSTAAVQNDVISVGGGDPTYFGLDAFTGTIMWKHNLGNPGAGYFAWTSPLIYTPPAGGAVQRWTAVGVASNCDAP